MNAPSLVVRRGIPATILVVLLVGITPTVVAHSPDPILNGSAWPQHEGLTFRWRTNAVPGPAIRSAVLAAADDNNDTRNSRAATFTYSSSGVGLIGYGPGATCGVNGIACFTRDAPDGGFTMWLREQGRVFDWGTLKWCQLYANPPNGCYDAETVALDEFGHIQGLGHHVNHADESDYLDAVVQAVSRTRPETGWNLHVYGPCDVAALQLRYDTPSSAAKISTCLDLDTTVTLSASPASIAYGGTTRLTAVLKVTDAAAAGPIGGSPLTSRTVRLQRRAPGTSTWTTVAVMLPTTASGTYSLTQKLQTDAEFRAYFATPSDEGLDGDTSPVTTVAVGPCTGSCPLQAPVADTEASDGG